jgi:hypothetical protein
MPCSRQRSADGKYDIAAIHDREDAGPERFIAGRHYHSAPLRLIAARCIRLIDSSVSQIFWWIRLLAVWRLPGSVPSLPLVIHVAVLEVVVDERLQSARVSPGSYPDSRWPKGRRLVSQANHLGVGFCCASFFSHSWYSCCLRHASPMLSSILGGSFSIGATRSPDTGHSGSNWGW